MMGLAEKISRTAAGTEMASKAKAFLSYKSRDAKQLEMIRSHRFASLRAALDEERERRHPHSTKE
jgi:hypothetical protein